MKKVTKKLIEITDQLCARADALTFNDPVHYVYNPLRYARDAHITYIKKYAHKNAVLWLGMNPGPFGMAQTGVPFGDVQMVTSFLGIEGKLCDVPTQHPKRPIDGFACKRSEVSGTRLWGYARDTFSTPEQFFSKFYVQNYCPLVFMAESAKNVTPDKLPKEQRDALFAICDDALRQFVVALESPFVVGVGAFAKGVCQRALDGLDIGIGQILHPSPASPAANRGWAQAAHNQLKEMKLI